MSHSIRDAIRDNADDTEAFEAIERLHPNAYIGNLPDGRDVWMSDGVIPTDVQFVVGRAYVEPHYHTLESGLIYLCGFAVISGRHVFTPSTAFGYASTIFRDLTKRHPEMLAAILKELPR